MNVLMLISEDAALCDAVKAAVGPEDMLLTEPGLEAGLRRTATLRLDAVLLDQRSGGLEAMEALQRQSDAPLWVVASGGGSAVGAAFLAAGARGVLDRTMTAEAFREALTVLFAGDRPPLPTPGAEAPPATGGASHQHQIALRWLGRTAAQGHTPERLAQRLVDGLMDVFDPIRCAVLLDDGGAIRVAASEGLPARIVESLCLGYTTGAMQFFDKHTAVLDRSAAPPEAAKELQLLGARLAAPLLRDGEVCGAVVLGECAAGRAYRADERDLLALMTRAASSSMTQFAGASGKPQAHLENLVEAAAAGLVAISADKAVTHLNTTAASLLGIDAREARGVRLQRLGSAFADAAHRALAGELDASPAEIHHVPTRARLLIHSRPDAAGGVLLTLYPVPERRVDTDDVSESPFWEYLSERVAQEIKNPMVAVKTFAQLLPRKYESPEFREAFSRVVQEEIARIERVAQTLSSFADDPAPMLRACNVNDTVRNVLQAFDDELSRRDIRLETDWGEGLESASLDPDRFGEAVEKVVQNSIDAMPEGGTLSVRTLVEGGRGKVMVADTGGGMQDTDEPNIFLPFYSTKERGMGLGLPLADRIMRKHKGSLTAAHREEGGSEFSLEFPTAVTQAGGTEVDHADHPRD